MYRTHYGNGMGAIDWGDIINQGISAGSNILGSILSPGTYQPGQQVPTVPATTTGGESDFSWDDILPLAAVGVGAFLLFKAMKPSRRR